MLILLFIFISIPDITSSQCDVVDNLTNGDITYSLISNCSLPYSDVANDCKSRDMQVLQLKTKDEMHFFSANIVGLGYDNVLFWIAYICPAIAVIPDDPNFCFMMTANITTDATNTSLPTAFVRLTYACDLTLGWICENKTDTHPCPMSTTTSPTTATSTTIRVTTPTTTDPITTTTTTTTTSTSTISTTAAPNTESVTTASTASTPTTTVTTTSLISTLPTSTSPTTDPPSMCDTALERRFGSNLYHVFEQCYQTLANASSLCVTYNSTLAVFALKQEMSYLADLTAGNRNGSWTFWIGGLSEVQDCVLFTLDRWVADNQTNTKYRFTLGYQCTESHPFVCKTFVDTLNIQLRLRQPDSSQGSVMDYRPTAIFLGSVGIGVLVMVLVVVIIIDMPNLVSDIRRAKRRVCWYKSKKNMLQRDVNGWKKGPTYLR